MSHYVFAALLLASVTHARFNQEQGNGALDAISALSDLGQPGQAATLAGTSVQFLLAAANPCGKLTQADLIITELGTSDAAIAAAIGLVAAEQNFNPFAVSVPSICNDASLPVTPQLRGVVPLIDPAVVGSALENANSNKSKISPFDATGLSVAQVMVAHGFSNFTAVGSDGTKTPATSLGTAASSDGEDDGAAAAASASAFASVATAAAGCNAGAVTTFVTVTVAAATATAETAAAAAATTAVSADADAGGQVAGTCMGSGSTLVCAGFSKGSNAVTNAVTGNFPGFVASTISDLNFGLCVPTIKFEAGLDGRSDTEFTFQAIDPLVNKGQEEALNPAIIMNRIHDQLTNMCGANQAAKDATAAAQKQVVATGIRNATTADMWNTLLGFAGTDINPDNAPQAGLVGHT
ncbi:hypothetical protein SPI_03885 [Niveomyces insectorum RCEF 264]|uniref:Circumsporozoite protein n=1 Tax=Niveomyces insectorum RCEF 264 TaxID=1081102 RepID=A0A162J4S9_9HYPO|nr:hypothetical protein SPI_03885 [Niveomyces insectorum RCEF 264]